MLEQLQSVPLTYTLSGAGYEPANGVYDLQMHTFHQTQLYLGVAGIVWDQPFYWLNQVTGAVLWSKQGWNWGISHKGHHRYYSEAASCLPSTEQLVTRAAPRYSVGLASGLGLVEYGENPAPTMLPSAARVSSRRMVAVLKGEERITWQICGGQETDGTSCSNQI